MLRVANLWAGRLSRAVRRAPGGATLLCLAASGCMTLGDNSFPPAPSEPPEPEVQTSLLPPVPMPAVPASAMVSPRPRPRKPREAHAAVREPAARASAEKQAALDPDALIGKSPADVRKLMGTPARVKDDQLSREWVYTRPGCNFRVFFYPNLNAASFRALKYGISDSNGGSLASSDACVRRILTARANAD
jgi:hypothetical protein